MYNKGSFMIIFFTRLEQKTQYLKEFNIEIKFKTISEDRWLQNIKLDHAGNEPVTYPTKKFSRSSPVSFFKLFF